MPPYLKVLSGGLQYPALFTVSGLKLLDVLQRLVGIVEVRYSEHGGAEANYQRTRPNVTVYWGSGLRDKSIGYPHLQDNAQGFTLEDAVNAAIEKVAKQRGICVNCLHDPLAVPPTTTDALFAELYRHVNPIDVQFNGKTYTVALCTGEYSATSLGLHDAAVGMLKNIARDRHFCLSCGRHPERKSAA